MKRFMTQLTSDGDPPVMGVENEIHIGLFPTGIDALGPLTPLFVDKEVPGNTRKVTPGGLERNQISSGIFT